MTLRDLTDDQSEEFRREAERNIETRNKSRRDDNQIDPINYKLFFSDGVKAVLARISTLP